jgi:hypothetical protein
MFSPLTGYFLANDTALFMLKRVKKRQENNITLCG